MMEAWVPISYKLPSLGGKRKGGQELYYGLVKVDEDEETKTLNLD